MVLATCSGILAGPSLSVLALSSRFDGLPWRVRWPASFSLSVLALSSRFDGLIPIRTALRLLDTFSTRSVESF